MSEKVVRLHEALEKHEIPHAFGGALAVDYYRVPRATIDIDLNVFLPPEDRGRVVRVLAEVGLRDTEALLREIEERDQGKTYWGDTRIDFFFSVSDFHDSAATRIRTVEYQDTTIPILSAEDIVVMKAVFARGQDWADIEAVCKLQGERLDLAYMTSWLSGIVGPDDPRIARLVDLAEESTG